MSSSRSKQTSKAAEAAPAAPATLSDALTTDSRDQLAQFDAQLLELEAFIKPMLQFGNLRALSDQLEPLQRAKLNMTLAYTTSSLFYMFLKTQGINPQKHPIKKEIARIQEYMNKIKAREQQQEQKQANVASARINKAAAQRFISAALSGHNYSQMGDASSVSSAAPAAGEAPAAAAADAATADSADEDMAPNDAASAPALLAPKSHGKDHGGRGKKRKSEEIKPAKQGKDVVAEADSGDKRSHKHSAKKHKHK